VAAGNKLRVVEDGEYRPTSWSPIRSAGGTMRSAGRFEAAWEEAPYLLGYVYDWGFATEDFF